MAATETNIDNPEAVPKVAGVLAEFDSPSALIAGARRVRERGFRHWDAHSPFPVHGLEHAMRIRMTILPWLVLGAGITGGTVALVMQWWANTVEYPLIISGKPLFSLPANIPVTFELIVLFSALTAFFGALILSRLPQYWHPAFASKAFERATTDGFFISVEAQDPKFDESEVRQLLQSSGATFIETCHAPESGKVPVALYWTGAIVLVLAPLPPLVVGWMRATTSSAPRIQFLKDMDSQPKYKAQTASPLFLDGRSNRLPPTGSIPRGRFVDNQHLNLGRIDGEWARMFPESVPLTDETMRRGRERYTVFCSACHGLAGDGDGITAQRAQQRGEPDWVPPIQLYVPTVRAQPVGQMYNTIANGIRKMPAYGSQIPVEDRWAIVLYVKALQRSQSATAADVPEEIRARIQ